jgi:hypothetical protein
MAFRIRRHAGSPAGGVRPAASAERQAPRAGAQSASPGGASPARRAVVADVLAHPVVKDALEVFDGEVMDVRDLSESGERRESDE